MKKANKKVNAAIIIIGNEILSGRTQDVNVEHLSKWLNNLGVKVEEVRVIADLEISIINTINEVRKKFNYVFTTGGIGPTHDDITSNSIAKAFKVKLIKNKKALNILKKFYNLNNLNQARQKMAYLPKGSELLYNPITKAAGFRIKNVYVMAGIPEIMKAMFLNIVKKLKRGLPEVSKTLLFNLPESSIAEHLSNIQNNYKEVEIGSYPFMSGKKRGVNIVLRSQNKKLIKKVEKEILKKIKKN